MSKSIHKVSVRQKLEPRREPYWAAPLAPGRFIGFRKIDAQRGSWIARARVEDGEGQQYRALGELTATFDYDAACKAAREWFAALDAGVVSAGKFTIADACAEYVEELRRAKRDKTAADAEWRFLRGGISEGGSFGAIEVTKLRSPAIKKWRDSLMAKDDEGRQMSKAGVNRMMTSLRAALNLAIENRRVPATAAIEWRSVKQYRNADRRREIYLDLTQRRALLEAATGGVRDLIEGVLVTGARPGELSGALRSAYDGRTKTLMLQGKTGSRAVPLSPGAVTLFDRLSKSKFPNAPLFTRDDGKPWQRAEWTEAVRAAAEAAVFKDAKGKETKLPAGVCLYSLRHSYITQAITDGLTTLEVARLTGTSLAMIDRHYGHLVQTSAERLAKVQML